MIFVDWISTPDHRNFNISFFSNLPKIKFKFYIFSEKLKITDENCIVGTFEKNRLVMFYQIYKICKKNRNKKIFFLTYDPLFLVIINMIFPNIYTYEHNTVPERIYNKHSIIQYLFYRKITRFAQYQGQKKMLRKLRQKVFFVGSPLTYKKKQVIKAISKSDKYFISPSYRENIDPLIQNIKLFGNKKIYIKKKFFSGMSNDQINSLNLHKVDRILLEGNENEIMGIIVTVDSLIRGTGWFNEAINRGIPIIIINHKTKKLFENTFPFYPYIYLKDINNYEDLEKSIEKIMHYNTKKYILEHNLKFKNLISKYLN